MMIDDTNKKNEPLSLDETDDDLEFDPFEDDFTDDDFMAFDSPEEDDPAALETMDPASDPFEGISGTDSFSTDTAAASSAGTEKPLDADDNVFSDLNSDLDMPAKSEAAVIVDESVENHDFGDEPAGDDTDEDMFSGDFTPPPPEKKSSFMTNFIGLICLLIAGAGGYFFFLAPKMQGTDVATDFTPDESSIPLADMSDMSAPPQPVDDTLTPMPDLSAPDGDDGFFIETETAVPPVAETDISLADEALPEAPDEPMPAPQMMPEMDMSMTPATAEEPAPVMSAEDAAALGEIRQALATLSTGMQSMQAEMAELKLSQAAIAESSSSSDTVNSSDVMTAIQSVNDKVSALSSRLNTLEDQVSTVRAERNAPPAPVETPRPQQPAAAIMPNTATPAPAASASVPAARASWILRAAQPGRAWLAQSGSSNIIAVAVGDNVPGLGIIRSVTYEGGEWIVRGTTGTVRQ